MDKAIGFLLLVFLAPLVLGAILTPIPDEILAIGMIGAFAGWLLGAFNR